MGGGGGGSSSGSGAEKSEWLLFNDFVVSEVSKDEVTQLYGHLKLPCLCLYTRVDKKPLNLRDSPITEALYRKITLGVAIPKSVPFKPFLLQGDDMPSPGYLVGIDAEFVQLVPAIMEKLAAVLRLNRSRRVWVLRGFRSYVDKVQRSLHQLSTTTYAQWSL